MNILPRDKQIDIIAMLCEGTGIRATARLTGTNRKTVGRLALQVGRGCTELHDRLMIGVRVPRIELDELWAFVGKKQRRVTREDGFDVGDQYTFIAMAASAKAIIAYHTGKRDSFSTNDFVRDLSERVLGRPEISSDGFRPYRTAIPQVFGARVDYGQIVKTLSVTDLRKDAAHRYSPAEVVAVARDVVCGFPSEISTSYVERGNLSVRTGCKRFARLTLSHSKKLTHHLAGVSLYVAHYNFCRVHEALTPDARHQNTPAMTVGVADHVWSIGELIDAALAVTPKAPVDTPSGRRRRFQVIEGGRSD
jgi:IS1 family transposase